MTDEVQNSGDAALEGAAIVDAEKTVTETPAVEQPVDAPVETAPVVQSETPTMDTPAPVTPKSTSKLKKALAAVTAAVEEVETDVANGVEYVKDEVEALLHTHSDGLARPITPAEQVAQHLAALQAEQAPAAE